VRVAVDVELRRREPGPFQGRENRLPSITCHIHSVDGQGLLDGVAHAETRIQRLVGVLIHELDLPTQRAHFPGRQSGYVLALEEDAAAVRFDHPYDGLRGGGLAAAGFADQRQQLP
jgi:hypothetical protein